MWPLNHYTYAVTRKERYCSNKCVMSWNRSLSSSPILWTDHRGSNRLSPENLSMRWAKRTGGEICYSIILDDKYDKEMYILFYIHAVYNYIYIYVYYSYICNRKYTNNIVLIYLYSVNETKDINFLELQSSVRAMMLSCAGVSKQGQGHWVQLVSGIILGGEDIHGYRKNPGKQHGIWKG